MSIITAIVGSIITFILGFMLGMEYKPPIDKRSEFEKDVDDQIQKENKYFS